MLKKKKNRIKYLSKNSNSIQFYDSAELLNEKLELNTWKLIQMLNRYIFLEIIYSYLKKKKKKKKKKIVYSLYYISEIV